MGLDGIGWDMWWKFGMHGVEIGWKWGGIGYIGVAWGGSGVSWGGMGYIGVEWGGSGVSTVA